MRKLSQRAMQIISQYEQESGNTVREGSVYDASGHFVCHFTQQLAHNYHENTMLSKAFRPSEDENSGGGWK